ncbi:MAG: TIGR03668 family PPOX class F420-dependent oxidoreductase [Candidatus Limnocylindrales bacterium]
MTVLPPEHVAFLDGTRRAVLGTVTADGATRLVPVCFAVLDGRLGPVIVSALDEKAKRPGDPHRLARVRDIEARPRVSLLADHWDEDWARLAWLRVDATASLMEPDHPEHPEAVRVLRARYQPYRTQRLEARPIIRLEPIRAVWWSAV